MNAPFTCMYYIHLARVYGNNITIYISVYIDTCTLGNLNMSARLPAVLVTDVYFEYGSCLDWALCVEIGFEL